jgi:hypothetical protein
MLVMSLIVHAQNTIAIPLFDQRLELRLDKVPNIAIDDLACD